MFAPSFSDKDLLRFGEKEATSLCKSGSKEQRLRFPCLTITNFGSERCSRLFVGRSCHDPFSKHSHDCSPARQAARETSQPGGGGDGGRRLRRDHFHSDLFGAHFGGKRNGAAHSYSRPRRPACAVLIWPSGGEAAFREAHHRQGN